MSALVPSAARAPLAIEPDGRSVPVHVAIIMDGNGRWAGARGMPKIAGHRAGAKAVRRVIEAAITQQIAWLTLYAFSSENWRRPASEVLHLTGLLRDFLKTEVAELHRNNVRLRVIGERSRFAADIQADLHEAERLTRDNTRLNLTVALSYGARDEILAAARLIARAAAAGAIDAGSIDEASFSAMLSTAGIPDPDLIVRTSGERRLSNFLLWQAAYAEFVFQDVLWPDYTASHLAEALAEFGRRERRFGARPA